MKVSISKMTFQILRQKSSTAVGIPLISGESFLLRRLSTAASARITSEDGRKMEKESLYKMLWAGGGIGMKMSDVLQLLQREQKHFYDKDLIACAKTFREYGHFQYCVQILEWMGKDRMDHSKGDHNVCLDILYTRKAIDEAEKYFGSLSCAAKTLPTYGTLLNYYTTRLIQVQGKSRSKNIRG